MQLSSKCHNSRIAFLGVSFGLLLLSGQLAAWGTHALITDPALSSTPEIRRAGNVEVRSLSSFLKRHAKELEALLEHEEQWLRKNLEWYKPRPDAIAFRANAKGDIVKRFLKAIRVRPNLASLRMTYLQVLPGRSSAGFAGISVRRLTFLKNTRGLARLRFVKIPAGASVSAMDVVATASDEPDLGMDIGLFTNNHTDFSKEYGFGKQPFGNPNLEFGSQAPFHMGFYHESGIMYLLAGFLKQSYPEYRIHLYKTLSAFAFKKREDYWGWRFMGWGLHYIGDLAQPYHSTPVPGIGTTRTICLSVGDMIGLGGAKKDAIQIVSNRHLAIESYQKQTMLSEAKSHKRQGSIASQLSADEPDLKFTDKTTRRVLSKKSHDRAEELDKLIAATMPERLVSDPTVELVNYPEYYRMVEVVAKEKGPKAAKRLRRMLVLLLRNNSSVTQAYMRRILSDAGR